MQFGDLRAPSALIEWTLVIKVQCRKVNRVKKNKTSPLSVGPTQLPGASRGPKQGPGARIRKWKRKKNKNNLITS